MYTIPPRHAGQVLVPSPVPAVNAVPDFGAKWNLRDGEPAQQQGDGERLFVMLRGYVGGRRWAEGGRRITPTLVSSSTTQGKMDGGVVHSGVDHIDQSPARRRVGRVPGVPRTHHWGAAARSFCSGLCQYGTDVGVVCSVCGPSLTAIRGRACVTRRPSWGRCTCSAVRRRFPGPA